MRYLLAALFIAALTTMVLGGIQEGPEGFPLSRFVIAEADMVTVIKVGGGSVQSIQNVTIVDSDVPFQTAHDVCQWSYNDDGNPGPSGCSSAISYEGANGEISSCTCYDGSIAVLRVTRA